MLDYFAADLVRADAIVALNNTDSTFWMVVKSASAIIFVSLVIFSFGRKSYRAPVQDLKNQATIAGSFLKTHQKKLVYATASVVIIS